MKINQLLIPKSKTKTRPGIKMTPKYITIHETGNSNKGANANAHARLQYNGNSRQASWHFQVDDKEIWQSLPTNEVGWHAGDGRGPGNMSSIAIEICVNSDGNFAKARANAAWLAAKLMKDHKIPIKNVVQHHKWSGKNCPQKIRAGGLWNSFIKQVEGEYKKMTAPKSEPGRTSTGSAKYRVVAGSFAEKKNAEAQVKKLKDKGFDAFILPI